MEVSANWIMTVATLSLIVSRPVTSQCTAGSAQTTAGEPISESGQYINLNHPAVCQGNLTAWHFCYYPGNENDFSVHFRVWRPTRGRRLYTLIHTNERTITMSGVRNNQSVLNCENVTLNKENYVQIEPNDVVGIYLPFFSSISAVGMYQSPQEGAGVYHENSLFGLTDSSVQRNDLTKLRNAVLHLYANIMPSSSPTTLHIPTSQQSTNPRMTTSSSPSQTSIPPSQSPNVNMERVVDSSNNNIIGGGGESDINEGVIAAVVIVVLLLIGAGIIVIVVVLVVCLQKRDRSLSSCCKGRRDRVFRSVDNLTYRAGSARIPFNDEVKQDNPYDIPRDHHDRTLYAIPKSIPASSISSSTYFTNTSSHSETVTSAPYSYFVQPPNSGGKKLPTVVTGGNSYDKPRGHMIMLEKSTPTNTHGNPEYLYMENASETTDGDEHVGGNYDRTMSEEEMDSNSDAYISISYTSVEYRKLLKKAAHENENYYQEPKYHAPPSEEDEIYIFLSKQKIKVIPRKTISKTGVLGSGEFATVEKGIWNGSKGVKEVAVKTLSESATDAEKISFLQEAVIMGQFVHPNIVQLHGIVTHGGPIMIVVEHMANRDLKKFLNGIRPEMGQLVPNNTPRLLLGFSQQVALGMHYLASKGFVHRDLAARNIFVSEDNNCKIGDFGRSRDLTDGYYKGHEGKVPLKWTAPEAIRLKKYSTASDVWSYGCLLYEIWSLGMKPFKGLSNREAINKISNGYRLPPPPGCPKLIYKLMIQCWHPAPAARPKCREMLTLLLDEEHKVLSIPMEDASTNPQACLLGAPIEEGEKMYIELQGTYLAEDFNKYDPDYEFATHEWHYHHTSTQS